MSNFVNILKVVLAERVINGVIDKVINSKPQKGSMYPLKLPEESTKKHPPSRQEVKKLVTGYFSSPEGLQLQDHFSAADRNKPLYHSEATQRIREIEKKATQALLKKIGLA